MICGYDFGIYGSVKSGFEGGDLGVFFVGFDKVDRMVLQRWWSVETKQNAEIVAGSGYLIDLRGKMAGGSWFQFVGQRLDCSDGGYGDGRW